MTGAGIIIEMPAAVKNRNRMSLTPEDKGAASDAHITHLS